MPQFLLKRIQALQKYTDIEVFVFEFSQTATWYTVQRNQIIKALPKDNFYSCGWIAKWTEENTKKQQNLINYLYEKNIDIVHLEELPEKWPTYGDSTFNIELQKELYNKNRPWKIVETLHSIDFNINTKVLNPDGYAFVINHHLTNTFKNKPGKKELIEYPIDYDIISNKPRHQILSEQGWRPIGEYHIVNVGLWTPGKNQKYLIDIAKILWEKYRWTYIFHLVGNQAQNFEDYWKPLMENLPPNIRIHGEKNEKDVSEYYKMADLMLFTSTWECNPIVLKEAISNNIKIMAFKLDHYKGIYDNYINYLDGNALSDKEKLVDVIHSPIKYKTIISNPVKDFANKHLKLYEDISNRR